MMKTIDENLSRRERKKKETHKRLMKVALQLFQEQGYEATTVEEITQAADVAKGTFFNYFETKEAILPALASWRFRQLETALMPEHGAPASGVARIKLALQLVADDPLAEPVLLRRLFAASLHRADLLSPAHALTNLLTEQVRQAQEGGEICDDVSAVYLGGVIHALFFQQLMLWYCGQRSAPLHELLDRTVDLLLNGVAGPQWKGTP